MKPGPCTYKLFHVLDLANCLLLVSLNCPSDSLCFPQTDSKIHVRLGWSHVQILIRDMFQAPWIPFPVMSQHGKAAIALADCLVPRLSSVFCDGISLTPPYISLLSFHWVTTAQIHFLTGRKNSNILIPIPVFCFINWNFIFFLKPYSLINPLISQRLVYTGKAG